MVATIIFATQSALALVSFGLLARWLIYPRLKVRPLVEALSPLLLLHTFRTVGLVFLVPTLVDPSLPAAFTIPGAVGDLLAAVLAFAALVALRSRWRVAPALAWLFTVEGIADFVNDVVQGLRFHIPAYHLGFSWLIPTYGVPALFVAHLLIVALLLRDRRPRGARRVEADRAAAESVISSEVANAV